MSEAEGNGIQRARGKRVWPFREVQVFSKPGWTGGTAGQEPRLEMQVKASNATVENGLSPEDTGEPQKDFEQYSAF